MTPSLFKRKLQGSLKSWVMWINVTAAARIAKSLPKGSTVVTILCDGGARYMSRLYNPVWLEENALTPKHHDLSFL